MKAGEYKTVVSLQNDGSLVTGALQDCDPIVEYAKAMHNEGRHGGKDMKLAASVPSVVVERYLHDNAITLQEFTCSADHQKRLLNDPALAAFRIWPGRV